MKSIYTILLLILISLSVSKAQFVVEGATFSVESDAIITIQPDAINNGEIQNKGIINLQQDWTNTNQYNTIGGEFILAGQTTQNINHADQNFNILKSSEGGRKIFNSGANISSNLILENGIIEVVPGNIFILENTATSTPGSDISHIDGYLYNSGSGYKFFPIGKDDIYAPVELQNVSNDLTKVGFEAINYNPMPEVDSDLASVSEIKYWQMELLDNNEFLSKISLSSDRTYTSEELQNIVVAEADNSSGMYRNIGKDENTQPSFDGITSLSEISGSFFAFGFTGSFFIPNTFAPGSSDPEEQVLKVYGTGIPDTGFSFIVFNKWRDIVFESNSLTEMKATGWNGNNKKTGEPEEAGMYSYILKGQTPSGSTIEKSGSVLIFK